MMYYEPDIDEFRKVAEEGDADHQYYLGQYYQKGEFVPKDHQEAVKWYRKAAEQGHNIAQKSLGWMYQIGKGVK